MDKSRRIKTIGQLKNTIEDLPDDYKLEVDFFRRMSDDELRKMPYPYPYDRMEGWIEFNDTSVSDRIACFGLYSKSEYDKDE